MAKEKKASKHKRDTITSAEPPSADAVTRKSKKRKKEKRKTQDHTHGVKASSKEKRDNNRSEKKKKKTKDKKAKDEVEPDTSKASTSKALLKPEDQSNSDKKPMNTETDDNIAKKTQESNLTGWNDWNKTSFGGDLARKEKFLKLIGAKKSIASDSQTKPSLPAKKGLFGSLKSSSFQPNPSTFGSSSLSDQAQHKIQSDLEHQFEEGLKFKKNMQRGVKRGLGA